MCAVQTAEERFDTADREEAARHLTRLFDATHVELAPLAGRRFHMALSTWAFDRVAIAEVEHQVDFTMTMDAFGLQGVGFCRGGAVALEQAGTSPGPAPVYTLAPDEPFALHRFGPGTQHAVMVPHRRLHRHLETLLDRDLPARRLRLTPRAASGGAPAAWAPLLAWIIEELHSGGAATHPLLAPQLTESLLTALLLGLDHPWRDQLDQSPPAAPPKKLAPALDAMQDDPAHPWTTGELATLCSLSPRTLQDAFRRDLDTTPTAYLRDVRLNRARAELKAADPLLFTVEAIARRWGFTHQPRFAQYYRARFGTTPRQDLHHGK